MKHSDTVMAEQISGSKTACATQFQANVDISETLATRTIQAVRSSVASERLQLTKIITPTKEQVPHVGSRRTQSRTT
jgi:hypothetical protein